MKLLLGNGSEYKSSGTPITGTTNVDGSFTSSVKYFVIGDLADIKKDFKDTEATNTVTCILDDKSVAGEFKGYQKFISISYDADQNPESDEDIYVVTMAIGNDIKKLIETWNETLSTAVSKSDNAVTVSAKASEELSTLKETVDTLVPVTDLDKMSFAEAKAYRINESKIKLQEYLATNPITSTAHKGKEASYSITPEKQQYLVSMIAIAEMAETAGVEYQPSWNATGEICTYDWTVTELKQLAFEMETVVRPLVSKQQKIENEISKAKSLKAVKEIEISY